MSAVQTDGLLAEDNSADDELVAESLSGLVDPRRIHRVYDGVDALDFLFGRNSFEGRATVDPPRLVLLDIELPRVDGLEVLEALRRHPLTNLVPVVMPTSSNVEWDIARAYRLGANGYVQKQVDFGAFRDTVRSLGRFRLSVNEPPRGAARPGDA